MSAAAASQRYWCERAVVAGAVRAGVLIAVDGGRIGRIELGVPRPGGATLLGGLVVPGFANAHSHAFQRALRGRSQLDRGSFWTWRDLMYRVAGRLDPERYHHLARAVFAEMVVAGFTSVGEFHYLHHRPDGTPYDDPNALGAALIAGAAEAGIRITLLDALYLHGGLGAAGHEPVSAAQRRFRDSDVAAWVGRVDRLVAATAATPGARVGAAVHSVRAVDPDSARGLAAWADRSGAVIHVHLSEQPDENAACLAAHGATPTAVLAGAGVLGPRTTAVHATHLTSGDVETLAGSGAGVCLCPTTERDLGDGIGPGAELAAAGVPLCVGSDSHAVIDPFEEARAVELDQRLRTGRRGVHTTGELLAMAGGNGQRSLGWDDAGTIGPGARADLVAVRLDSVRTAGTTIGCALEAVLFAATAAEVTDVVVDGRHLVVAGRHTTIDVAAELDAAIAGIGA